MDRVPSKPQPATLRMEDFSIRTGSRTRLSFSHFRDRFNRYAAREIIFHPEDDQC